MQELDKDPEGNAADIAQREDLLLPLYTQVAHEFADMHDRTGRMTAKGAIRFAVPWKDSRRFFFKRVMRRLAQQELANTLLSRCSDMAGLGEAFSIISEWASKAGVNWESDDDVLKWLKQDQSSKVEEAVRASLARKVAGLLSQLGDDGIEDVLKRVSEVR